MDEVTRVLWLLLTLAVFFVPFLTYFYFFIIRLEPDDQVTTANKSGSSCYGTASLTMDVSTSSTSGCDTHHSC